MNIELSGKRALVTGGNSGIGKAIASALGEAGARVAVNYIEDPDAAGEIVDQIQKGGSEAFAIQSDISDAGQVHQMFREMDDRWDGIDILVNNAGIDGGHSLSWEIEVKDWRKVLEVNLIGAFHCCREALQRMIPKEKGVILNMTSVHERIPWTGYSAYTTSKSGLSMLTQTLAQEAAPHNVRVVALAPGAIKTPINKNVWSDPQKRKDLLDKIPLGRIGETEDIAGMAVVLVSEVAGYVTGTTVFVDGGMTDYPDFIHGG